MKEDMRRTSRASRAQQRKRRNRRIALTLCVMFVVLAASIGGTVAWLTDKTGSVVNTFTYGDINIGLTETTGTDYKIVPGVDIAKDPKVTVNANSEGCWLFVKVEEAGTFVEGKVTYSIEDGWTKGDGADIPENVYYREVSASENDQNFAVLKDDKVYVSEDLTKAEVNDITADNQPKLTFTAYAVQKAGVNDAAAAWEKLNPTPAPTPPTTADP